MITVKEKFGATLILDDMLILPNFWDVTVNMEPNPAFAEYWYDSKIKFFNLTPSGMKLNVSDWEKFDLAFDKKPGDVVSLDTFRRKFKPRDDDDGTDIA